MSQTIITKFIPRANLLSARVRATAKGSSVIVMWEPKLTADANHANAAKRTFCVPTRRPVERGRRFSRHA